MKKVFTLALVALMTMMGIQSALAQTAIFSLVTEGDGTATVGTFVKSGVNNSDDTQEPKRWTMKSTGAYIECTCTQPLAEGDEIVITGTPKSTSTAGFILRTEGVNTADAMATLKSIGKAKEQTTRYTVAAGSGLIGKSTIYVMMEQQARQWWISKVEVLSGTSTGISSAPVVQKKLDVMYDLQGHKITSPQKGHIYLRHGKKIVY